MKNHPTTFLTLVRIKKFSELSGYSEQAVRKKIYDGHWREGKHFFKAPDGRINIDIVEVQKWMRRT